MTEAKSEKVEYLSLVAEDSNAVVNLEFDAQQNKEQLKDQKTVSHHGESHSETHSDLIAKIFREHNAALVRFLSAKLPSIQDAQEVAQEAYVRMLRLDEPHTISHLQAYLFKIATNIAIDRIRQRNRRPEAPDFEGIIATVRCPSPLPDEKVEVKQKIAQIKDIIKELPPKCRLAFLLYKFKGMPYRDIARQMNLTESMIRKYVLRAVVYCRERLD